MTVMSSCNIDKLVNNFKYLNINNNNNNIKINNNINFSPFTSPKLKFNTS